MQEYLSVRSLRRLSCLICIAALTGCSLNPVVRWDPPKSSDVPSYTLDYAKAYARTARRAYQEGIDQQTTLSTGLSSGLIGLGGVLAALAAYHAHADALIGTALFGGTAYALGNWNLSKPRLLILQTGVEGINCSLRAVAPLDMTDSDLRDLNVALAKVEELVPTVQNAIEATRAALARAADSGLPRDQVDAANAAIAEADRGIIAANATLLVGRKLSSAVRRAGNELVNTVDRIDAAVSKAILDTIPDLTAVPKVIGGLAGFASGLAPGAGLDQAITNALASYQPKAQGPTVEKQRAAPLIPTPEDLRALKAALSDMTAQSQRLAIAVSQVRARITGYDSTTVADSLKDCGVAEISLALHVTPEKVTFTGGADETSAIVVTGGTKPYVAILQQTPADGLTVRNPAPFDSTVQVIASKALAKNKMFSLIIMDSSTPSKIITVPIVVGEVGKANTRQSEDSSTPNMAALADQIKNVGTFKFLDTDLSVSTSAPGPANNRVDVTLTCKPSKPARCLDSEAVRDVLLSKTADGPSVAGQGADSGRLMLPTLL
jgi:hypothetical protein